MRFQPHRARYRLLDGRGRPAGREDLVVERAGQGYHVTSVISASYPMAVEAELQWRLDGNLGTRLLYIHSTDGWGEEFELEATVTGNGVLAHRSAPSGPTQVELGWGAAAEFDYISAAFPAVIMARSFSEGAAARDVEVVEFGVEDLVPTVVARRYQRLTGPDAAGVTARSITLETDHAAVIEVAASGALLRYEGLLEVESFEGEPTR